MEKLVPTFELMLTTIPAVVYYNNKRGKLVLTKYHPRPLWQHGMRPGALQTKAVQCVTKAKGVPRSLERVLPGRRKDNRKSCRVKRETFASESEGEAKRTQDKMVPRRCAGLCGFANHLGRKVRLLGARHDEGGYLVGTIG
ncbi:transmembrane channel-like protein 2 [Anopheles sinensis]|uniref:Transmembrane channel-like protein 2 n=1 Tax=Anopheles sinensis TaxID=74873 RepID=A0A084WD07_ANOSI|nr:transmembrane channel-like protein 2 [Anopheles sinensis]